MIGFTVRNLKVFFKDKSAVFFSLLAVFIIIGLYALFLGDVWVSSFEDLEGVPYLMDSWIMAGLLAVTGVTTTMGAFEIMVSDKAGKVSKDFVSSPIKNKSLVGGYVLSAVIIGIIMSIVALVLLEIYIVMGGGELLSIPAILETLLLIVLSTASSASIIFFIVTFFESVNAFATASTVIGTLIGFLAGIYLPVGSLPEGVQLVVKCFPVSHAASLFRQLMLEAPMSVTFAGAPAESISQFKEQMGVTFSFGDTVVTPLMSIIALLLTTVVFYSLALLNISRKKK